MSNNTNDNNLLTFLKNQSLFNQSPQRRMSSRSRDRKSARGSPSPGHNQNMNYTTSYNQTYTGSNPINIQENYKTSSTLQGSPTNVSANYNLQGGNTSGNYQTTTTTYNTTGGSNLQGNANFQGNSTLQGNSNLQGTVNYQSGTNYQGGNYQGGSSNLQGNTTYQTTSYQSGGNIQGGAQYQGLTTTPGSNYQGQYTTTTTTMNSTDVNKLMLDTVGNLVTYSNSFESARV